jgi:hypothetical protein
MTDKLDRMARRAELMGIIESNPSWHPMACLDPHPGSHLTRCAIGWVDYVLGFGSELTDEAIPKIAKHFDLPESTINRVVTLNDYAKNRSQMVQFIRSYLIGKHYTRQLKRIQGAT